MSPPPPLSSLLLEKVVVDDDDTRATCSCCITLTMSAANPNPAGSLLFRILEDTFEDSFEVFAANAFAAISLYVEAKDRVTAVDAGDFCDVG